MLYIKCNNGNQYIFQVNTPMENPVQNAPLNQSDSIPLKTFKNAP